MYILLFVYAALSKLLDFQNFRSQIGLSPLLSSFADYVSVGVIVLEIGIALLLFVPKFRLIGLYGSFSLMVMFSTYIFLILNYSSFIPCSCGGILEKMGWQQHLVFNLIFVLLSGIGIIVVRPRSYFRKSLYTLVLITMASIGIVALLYLLSEDMIKHKNSFIRRFPHGAAERTSAAMDLKYTGYYFAGVSLDKIYLANYTAPLQIIAMDSGLKQIKPIKLNISNYSLPFRSVQVKIIPPYFYVMDGSVPVIFKGNISNWTAYPVQGNYGFFLRAEPMDSIHIILRAQLLQSGENILGTFAIGDTTKSHYSPKVLEKQIDGFFDTDGTFSGHSLLNF